MCAGVRNLCPSLFTPESIMELHKGLKPLPPLDILKYHYRYEPEEGKLYRRNLYYCRKRKVQVYANTWREVRSSNVALKGYGQYYKYRIMWCLYYGEDPYPYVIDHINRDHGDNRIVNLRKVTPKENTANRSSEAVTNAHSRKPVLITYPDERGTIVTESLKAAAEILNRKPGPLQRSIERGGVLYHSGGSHGKPNGIVVEWALP